MIRFIRRIVLFIGVIGLILVGVAYLLPRDVSVSREVAISAPVDKVFPLVNSLKNMSKWSPWVAKDPAIKLAFSGPDEGVGAKMGWSSTMAQVGNGTQEITESVAGQSVVSRLIFGEMGPTVARFDLASAAGGTTVTWSLTADMGMNPMARWAGLMMDRWVGPDFETGLAHLKAMAEAR